MGWFIYDLMKVKIWSWGVNIWTLDSYDAIGIPFFQLSIEITYNGNH